MTDPTHNRPLCPGSRRQFLWQAGAGFAGLALTALLDRDGFFARHAYASAPATYANPLAPRAPHFAPGAKRCIFLFMYGGPSSHDTWDYKPELQRNDGKTVKMEIRRGSFQEQKLLASRR